VEESEGMGRRVEAWKRSTGPAEGSMAYPGGASLRLDRRILIDEQVFPSLHYALTLLALSSIASWITSLFLPWNK
jgi:hypothetical protein